MATTGESSSLIPSNSKPVIVRVKRKAHQSCLDAFWLEIKENPSKRALIDLENLSLSDLSAKVQEPKRRKLLVQHVETVTTSEVTTDILQSLVSDLPDELQSKGENAETRHRFNTGNVASQSARFEQIWRRRRDKKEMMHDDDDMVDMCQLYDVVRVDEKRSDRVQRNIFPEVEDDCKMMANFLPLLREVMPTAAAEVEDDILDRLNGEASTDTFVFDYYAVKDNNRSIIEESTESPFPLVQVQEEEEYYNGPDESEYETDDSNAENNPMNDYPDEESTDENSETECGFPDDLSSKEEEEEEEEETDESIDGISLEDGDEQPDWSSYWSKYLREEDNNSEDDEDDKDEDDDDNDEDHDDDDFR